MPRFNHEGNVFIPVLLVSFVILSLVGIYLYTQKQSVMKEKPAIPTATPTFTPKPSNTVEAPKKQQETLKATEENRTYSAGGIYDKGQLVETFGKQYTITVLPKWEIHHEWSDYSDDLYLISTVNPEYKLKISQGARSGFECTYNENVKPQDHPYTYYSNYIELTDADGNKYRRENWAQSSGMYLQNDTLVCGKSVNNANESTFGSSTPVGNIWYIFPTNQGFILDSQNFNQTLILQMDTMVKSLKAGRK